MRRAALGLLPLVATLMPAMAAAPSDGGLKVDRVVMVMRHGVRPPTKDPAMPAGVAAQAWPVWDVPAGWLTARGTKAVTIVAGWDRTQLGRAGVLPARGCPAPGAVRMIADSDQRTIATAGAYVAGFAPGCRLAIDHHPQDEADARFSPLDDAAGFDAARAQAAVLAAAGPGGVARVEAGARPVLTRIDQILCGGTRVSCGVAREPSGLSPVSSGKRPKLTGALDRGSTAAQILLLEYADGKPMRDVGWGRATAADVTAASSLHALEFRLLARPHYIAAHLMSAIGPQMLAAIDDDHGPALTLFVGHDTQVGALGGLLDVHWRVPGLATDDPSPGGALGFERLVDRAGHRYVRAVFRGQGLEQIRGLTPLTQMGPYRAVLPILGCSARGLKGLCTLADFDRLMRTRLDSAVRN